jgi:hypothetical protein
MAVEILTDRIQAPAQNNLTWVFCVRVDGGEPREWQIDSFDLDMWFKEAVGRYPHHEGGDKDTKKDVLENWDRVEPRLRREAEKQAALGLEIAVEGLRIGSAELQAVRNVPSGELPPLTEMERTVAKKLGVSEEDYARNLLAGHKTTEFLYGKTERLARHLQAVIAANRISARIERIALINVDHRFDVEVRVNGSTVLMRIDENVVDDLFEGGSAEAEERLQRIVRTNLQAGAAR